MRVLHFSSGADTGGQGMATKAAFERLAPEFEIRVIATGRNRLGYPTPERFTTWTPLRQAFEWADLIVLHNDVDVYAELGRGKPVILHHHGSRFRAEPEKFYAAGESIGAVQVVSTVDLMTSLPKANLTWLPQVVDTEELAALRESTYKPDGVIRIAHAPTNWDKKNTREVIGAVSSISRHLPVELVLIDGSVPTGPVPWPECLTRKAACDILVDQFELGYGGNSVEAWALGLPVVSGATPTIQAKMHRVYRRRTLPFMQTELDALEGNLVALIMSADLRAEYAKRGMAQVQRFHSQEAVVAQLRDLYETTVSVRKAA